MRVTFPIQKVLKAREAFLDSSWIDSWGSFAEPHSIFGNECVLLKVLGTRGKAFFSKSQRERFRADNSSQTDAFAVGSFAFKGEDGVDTALQLHAVFMMKIVIYVISDDHFFSHSQISLNA